MLKYTFILFFVVSCILSVMMFIQIPSDTEIFYKLILGMAAIAFEIGKIQMWKDWVEHKRVLSFVFTMMFISVSILASVSFIIGSLNYQLNVSEGRNEDLVIWENNIKSIDEEINNLVLTIKELDPKWVSAKIRLSDKLSELRLKKLEMKRPDIENKANISNVFLTFGKVFKIDSKLVMVYFFIVFSLMLEIGAVWLYPRKITQHTLKDVKNKTISKVFQIGNSIINNNGVVDKDYIKATTKLQEKDIDAVISYFVKKGYLTSDLKLKGSLDDFKNIILN